MQHRLFVFITILSACLSSCEAACEDQSTSESCSSATDCTWYDGKGCFATDSKGTSGKDTKSKGTSGKDTKSKGTSGKDTKSKGTSGKGTKSKGTTGTGTGSLTGPKILVLHGGGSSALGERSSPPFQALMSSLSGFQFVYAQGGYPVGSGALWIPDPPSKGEPTTSAKVADASLQILDDIVRTQGPFYGILGYSQGSAFVPIYLSHAPANTFQVAMMFCGYLTTTHQGLLGLVNAASPFNNIASLVWMGGQDTIITNAMTDEQAGVFTDPVRLLDVNGGHALPLPTSPTFAKVISFVNNNTATTAHQGKDSQAPYPPVSAVGPDSSSTSVTPFKMMSVFGATVALFLF